MAAAFAVSSAGPIFTGAEPLDPITRREAAYLLANQAAGGAHLGAGISAFPSMHVAIAVWLALLFPNWVTRTYAAFIAVGAVTLGWHYSIDVVGGTAVAVVSYRLALQVVDTKGRDQRPTLQPSG